MAVWTEPWAGAAGAAWGALWASVEEVTAATVVEQTGASEGHIALENMAGEYVRAISTAPDTLDVTISGYLRHDATANNRRVRFYLRSSGDWSGSSTGSQGNPLDGYELVFGGGNLSLVKHSAGTRTTVGTATTYAHTAADTDFTFSVVAGVLTAKMWDTATEVEADATVVTYTDPSPLTTGGMQLAVTRNSGAPAIHFGPLTVDAATDATAPTITVGPAATAVADTTATITWTTDEASDSEVEYSRVVELAGTSAVDSDGDGSLTSTSELDGTSTTDTAGEGTLTDIVELAGVSISDSDGSGLLTSTYDFAGTSTTQTDATGELSALVPFAGTAATATDGTGVFTSSLELAGTSTTDTAGTGDLSLSPVDFAGTSTTNSAGTGGLTVGAELTYHWTNNAATDVAVTIIDPTSTTPTFVCPRPATGETEATLLFDLTVTAPDGLTDTATQQVTITHAGRYRHVAGTLIPVLSYTGVNV